MQDLLAMALWTPLRSLEPEVPIWSHPPHEIRPAPPTLGKTMSAQSQEEDFSVPPRLSSANHFSGSSQHSMVSCRPSLYNPVLWLITLAVAITSIPCRSAHPSSFPDAPADPPWIIP